MKQLRLLWCFWCLLGLIQNVTSRHPQRFRNQFKSHAQTASTYQTQKVHNEYLQKSERKYNTPQPQSLELEIEVDTLKCPIGCVCQYAHFMDLPISRWINFMQAHQPEKAREQETAEDLINENEATFAGDESFLENPFIKQATCILQDENDAQELINSLPHDLQALILLYTGIGRNKTITTSILKPLNQLTTLEIRGPQDRTLRLVFDEPLSFLQNANFESITLLGSDTFKRPKNAVHPRDLFDYIPKIEQDFYLTETEDDKPEIESDTTNDHKSGLEHAQAEIEVEILPYDVYLQEVKKARMPSFYGWEHLEVLRIHSCQLNELHWEIFDGLDSLQHLSLERNAIEVVTALALFGANNIRTLSLAHNAIQDLHYRALGGLLKLELLDLSDNKLTKLSEMSFPPFPKLERADFRNNPIRYIFPATFGVMNNTRTLHFGSKEVALELWSNEPFQWLNKLRELSLENVSIGNLEHNTFQGLNSLETLNIKGSIRSLEFDAFADQTELREIDLSDCQVQEISMDAFMGCKKLEVVNLAHNNLSYIPPGLFDDQKNLEEIYLEGNQLRTLPTTFFQQPKLKLARLTENRWKCSCDMYNWRAKLTNQVRGSGPRQERCITDYHTGKQLSCRKVDNYQFDHRYAPRCDNYNGRSVFYVVRKNLQCGQGRVVNVYGSRHRQGPGQRMHKLRQMDEHRERYKEKLEQKKLVYGHDVVEKHVDKPTANRRLTWQIKREEKMRQTLAKENSIEHVLLQQRQHEEQLRAHKTDHRNTKTLDDDAEEISNEI